VRSEGIELNGNERKGKERNGMGERRELVLFVKSRK